MHIEEIFKRNHSKRPFEIEKITDAILKSMLSVENGNPEDAEKIAKQVYANLLERKKKITHYVPNVEEIQDLVEQTLMKSLAETQVAIRPILQQLVDGHNATHGVGIDEITRTHIRNIDLQLTGLREESRTDFENLLQQMRSVIKLLARTLAATSDHRRG